MLHLCYVYVTFMLLLGIDDMMFDNDIFEYPASADCDGMIDRDSVSDSDSMYNTRIISHNSSSSSDNELELESDNENIIYTTPPSVGRPNINVQLDAPLHNHSIITTRDAIKEFFVFNATHKLTKTSFGELFKFVQRLLPEENNLPSLYKAMQALEFDETAVQKYHACPRDHCIFQQDQQACPTCNSPRFDKKLNPLKVSFIVYVTFVLHFCY
jgi:hypothetical protein